jgi:hypothetical protein
LKHVNIKIHVFCDPSFVLPGQLGFCARLPSSELSLADTPRPAENALRSTKRGRCAPRASLARFRRAARCADDVDLAPAAPNHVSFLQRSHAHASGMASALRHLQTDISSPQPASSCGLRDDACTQESIVSRLMFHERGRITTKFLCHVLQSCRQLHLPSCRRALLYTNLSE